MPELPEVETIKRDLEKKLIGQKILAVTVHDPRVIRNCSSAAFIKNLKNKTFRDVSRRGKAIILSFTDPGYWIVQPMMTGQLILRPRLDASSHRFAKVTLRLSNGYDLNYNDQRLFGRLNFYRTLDNIEFFQSLGPEPFGGDFSLPWLKNALAQRSVPIKNLLMHQNFVAGIGNIYASEILFASGIKPTRPAKSLIKKEIEILHKKTIEILEEAIQCRGTSMNSYRDAGGQKGNFIDRIQVYGREGQPCFKCQKNVERLVQAGRSTFFCRRCQK